MEGKLKNDFFSTSGHLTELPFPAKFHVFKLFLKLPTRQSRPSPPFKGFVFLRKLQYITSVVVWNVELGSVDVCEEETRDCGARKDGRAGDEREKGSGVGTLGWGDMGGLGTNTVL